MLLLHSLSQRRYSSEIPRESRHYRIHSFSSMLPNASVTPRLSLTPSELVVIEIGRRNSHHSMHLHFNTSRRPSAAIPIKKIKSELSLTRSQSMMLKPLVKHSPDCKDNCFWVLNSFTANFVGFRENLVEFKKKFVILEKLPTPYDNI